MEEKDFYTQKQLSTYRSQIDEVDTQLLFLLNQRLEIQDKIIQIKRKNSFPLYDSQRERLLLNKIELNDIFDGGNVENKKKSSLVKRIFLMVFEQGRGLV